jgi:ApeA N-terminal domain 1
MPTLPSTRFEGTLSGHGSRIPVGFAVEIDELGRLQLELDRLPVSQKAMALRIDQRPGSVVDLIELQGRSETGALFRSDSFQINNFSHGSKRGQELSYQGSCYDAEIVLPRTDSSSDSFDLRVWHVRQFRTFHRIEHETQLGTIVIAGPKQDREAQEPNGFLSISPSTNGAGDTWWAESERFLTHLARLMSFASDTYLTPVIEERYSDEGVTINVFQQSRASAPFMPPFHMLNMQPIFASACDSYFNRYDEIAELDAAIRWLTSPVAYDENRLLNAMSALENIIDRCAIDGVDKFLRASAFKKVAQRIRLVLTELEAPAGMKEKVSELNRRSLADKIMELLNDRKIVTTDLPTNWLNIVIRQRNMIVHTGISGDIDDQQPDILDHTIWVREIVTRLILQRLGFSGAYRSWLHNDQQWRFPECIAMGDWIEQQVQVG